jgi:uroporphyrin-III C-methyltransferase
MSAAGKVYLIGAGPGDPELLTLRAARALRESEVIMIDHLVEPALLEYARPGAEVIDTGKSAGQPCIDQESINRLLIDHARRGRVVARLKGGDPFIFGRGGEEASALVDAGVDWEVIPGVSAANGASAYAGIPLLHRDCASSVAFVTGHAGRRRSVGELRADTLVVFMCGSTLAQIAQELLSSGRPANTPAALIASGTRADQRVYTGTIDDLLEGPFIEAGTPVLAVIGAVVGLAEKLHWFARTPSPLRTLALSAR